MHMVNNSHNSRIIFLFFHVAALDEGERAFNLHDSYYDRELSTKTTALPAGKVFKRLRLETDWTIVDFAPYIHIFTATD